jgi:GntR family transcriptional regulator
MELDKVVNGAQSDQSPIRFRLNASSGVPTYVQLVTQVEQALRIGYLNVGDRLPRIKEVVESLAINPNTVLKAYRELETKGIASGRPGVGTFIVASPPTLSAEAFEKLRQDFIDGWLESALKEGLDHADILTLVQSTLESRTNDSTVLTGRVSQ